MGSFKSTSDNCDYGGQVGLISSTTFNAMLNIFGLGTLVDPVGCMYELINEVEADKRDFLDDMTYEMFAQNLVISQQQVQLSSTFAEYNELLSQYYYEISNGKYNIVSISLVMVAILVFIIFFYLISLPSPQDIVN